MNRKNATMVGLLAMAFLAMSIFIASGAQATPEVTHKFICLDKENDKTHVPCVTLHNFPVKTHREHDGKKTALHQFDIGGASVECEVVEAEGEEIEGTSENLQISPVYEECETTLGDVTHWKMNGCGFLYSIEGTQETTSPPEGYEKTEGIGSAKLICPAEKTVTIETTTAGGGTKCHVEVHEQDTIKPVYFRNKKEPLTDITIESATSKMKATTKGGFFNCGVFDGEHEAFFTANTTFRAFTKEGKDLNFHFDDGKTHEEETES